MQFPGSIKELESRCWTIAGERMIHEPVATVLVFAERAAAQVISDSVDDVYEPVATFFSHPLNDQLAGGISRYEWQSVAGAFLAWASSEHRRVSPFVQMLDGLEQGPPDGGSELTAWVERFDLTERLDDPLAVVAPFAPSYRTRNDAMYARTAVVRDGLEGTVALRYGDEMRLAARSYLAWQAGRKAREDHYATLMETGSPSSAVMEAVARIRRLIHALAESGVPPGPVPVEGTRIRCDDDFLSVTLSFQAVGMRGSVWLSLLERTATGAARSSADHVHTPREFLNRLYVLAEHTIEMLLDPSSEHHEDLRQALEAPRWTRLLAQLEREVEKETSRPTAFADDERLVWRVGRDPSDGPLVLDSAVQKKRKRGWTKGRKMEWPVLLNLKAPLDPRDSRAVEAWYGRGLGVVERHSEGEVLEALVGHPRVVWADDPGVPLRVKRGSLGVLLSDEQGVGWIRFRLDERVLDPTELLAAQVGSHLVLLEPEAGEVTIARTPTPMKTIAEACQRWQTGLPAEADDAVIALLARLPPRVGIELPARLRGARREPDLTPTLRLEPLPGGGLGVEITMTPLSVGPSQPPGAGPVHLIGVDAGERVHTVRDLAAERRAVERCIAAFGLESGAQDGLHTFRLDEPEDALDLLAALRESPEAARVEWPKDATPWRVVGTASSTNLKVTSKKLTEWFSLTGEVTLDEGKIALAQIMAAMRHGRRYVRLGKGRFARIEDDLRQRLESAQDVVFEDGKELGVSGAALAKIEELLPPGSFTPDRAWKALKERLAQSASMEARPPEGLQATLRDYQIDGICWLLRVASWAEGACLADDMGLGKTLQALALVLDRAASGPALVVCPTSLSDNWKNESARFTPGLRPRLYRGLDRAQALEDLGPGDVLITSYDVLLRDIEALSAIPLSTVVFDEAHMLKNPDAQRTKAASQLQAGFRLGLTGTPLENHLGELWSLYWVLMPGLLGPRAHFRERFASPIERDADPARKEALRTLMRPFLLRRTKDQVAPELPPRVEVVRTVDLSEDERALYEAERRHALEQLADDDPKKKRFAVLAALTRLRRLACHPTLVHPTSTVASSKLEAALELFYDLRSEGHRALVFSQFTTHLGIVHRALAQRGVPTLYLDGQTPAKKRAELVDAWQQGEGAFFLISLKAGGTGLNLTAADTVVHLDPWWNPAAEDQASDRTHRIGQDKPVTVIRLVSAGTIEETVVALHESKRELARGILEGAETNAALGADELMSLLAG